MRTRSSATLFAPMILNTAGELFQNLRVIKSTCICIECVCDHWSCDICGFYAGLLRCGKSCRLRWANYLRPDLKTDTLTKKEEKLVIHLRSQFGNKYVFLLYIWPCICMYIVCECRFITIIMDHKRSMHISATLTKGAEFYTK